MTVSRCSVALAERRQTGGEKEAIEDKLDLMRANCQAAAVVRPAWYKKTLNPDQNGKKTKKQKLSKLPSVYPPQR